MNEKNEPSFFIKSTENAFTNRQKNIFDQLNLVDKEKKQDNKDNELDSASIAIPANKNEDRHYRKETKHFRGKESIFKRPVALPPRFKSHDTPDYQRNPGKWTKYTLGDVSQDDMSERSNTNAAMTFLKELADRKEALSEDDGKDIGDKIVFKPRKKAELNPSNAEDVDSASDDTKVAFQSSKLVMPEYIVGREKKKLKRSSKSDNTEGKKSKEIKLSHLDEEDE